MSRVFVKPLKSGGNGPQLNVDSLGFSGEVNQPFTPQQLLPSGGTAPYTFSALGLPAGVSLDPVTGIISGTPTVVAATTASATVTDAVGNTKTVPVFFSVFFDDTLFSDTLSDGTGNMGPIRDRYSFLGVAAYNVATAAGGLTFSELATIVVGGSSATAQWIPRRVGGALDQEQFAEIVFVSNAGINVRAGLSVLGFADGRVVCQPPAAISGFSQSYELWWRPNVPALSVARVVNGAEVFLAGDFAYPANGTKVGMTVRFGPGATNTIEVFYNDVSQGVRVDALGTVSQTGMPGFFIRETNIAGSTITFRDFRCGILSKF